MISVVVVTYDSGAVIGRCLEAFGRVLPADSELIVVDNASSDDTRDIVVGFDRAQLLANPANVGYGAGCNAGVRVARGDWVMIANPDVVVQDFNMSTFYEDADDPKLGLVAFSVAEGSDSADYNPMLRQYPRWWSGVLKSSWGLVQPRQLGEALPTLAREPVSSGMWASGALFAVRREAWEAVGGFDERFFLYFEDVDLSRRVKAAGFRITASAAVRAVHAPGQSSGVRDPAIAAAWEAASWLLYVGIWEGPERAWLAARLLLMNLRLVRLALHLARKLAPRSTKLRAKTREISHVATVVSDGLQGVCVAGERTPARCVALAVGAETR